VVLSEFPIDGLGILFPTLRITKPQKPDGTFENTKILLFGPQKWMGPRTLL
jgi:hypothetical protein